MAATSNHSTQRESPRPGDTTPWKDTTALPRRSMWELRIGGVTVDVPRSVGYYGGVAAAVGLGLVEPPLGIFIAGIPVIKALTHRAAPLAIRLVGEILEGGAKPIGGDADAVVRIDDRRLADEKAAEIAAWAERGRAASGRDRPPAHVTAGA